MNDYIWVVVHHDRHSDDDIYLHADRDSAIADARVRAALAIRIDIEDDNNEYDYEVNFYDTYEIYITYSCEGDCVYVVGKKLML